MNPLVLIVEDNDTIRNLLVIALEHRGWKPEELIVCLDAESADTVLQYTAVDCIVSDFNLGPTKMNGLELFDLWAHKYAGKFILHTGDAYAPARRGMAVVLKPADVDTLVALIRAAAVAAGPESQVPSPKSGHRTTDTALRQAQGPEQGRGGLRTASVSLASDFGPRAGIQPPTLDCGLRTQDSVIR